MDAEPVSAEKVQQALRAQMCAHRAMDAPKHFPAAAVLAPSKEPRVAAGVHARAPRSMKVFLGGVDFHTPGLNNCRTFALFEKELQEQLPGGSAWMPDQVVRLGFEAGQRVRQVLLQRIPGQIYFKRSCVGVLWLKSPSCWNTGGSVV